MSQVTVESIFFDFVPVIGRPNDPLKPLFNGLKFFAEKQHCGDAVQVDGVKRMQVDKHAVTRLGEKGLGDLCRTKEGR